MQKGMGQPKGKDSLGLPPAWKRDSVRELLVAGASWKEVEAKAKEMWSSRLKYPVRDLTGEVWAHEFHVALTAKVDQGLVRVRLDRGEFERLKDSKCLWYVLDDKLMLNQHRIEALRAAKQVKNQQAQSLRDRVHVVERVEARGDHPAFEHWILKHADATGKPVWMLCMMRARTGQTQWWDALLDRNVNLAFDEAALKLLYGSVDFWCEKCRPLTHQEVLAWEKMGGRVPG